MKNVNIVTIGDELLIGQVIDSNSAWIGQQCNLLGLEIRSKIAVGDEKHEMIEAMRYSGMTADVVLVTGGLGPTKDDCTKDAISEYFETPLTKDEATYKKIYALFEKRGIPFTDGHERQCYLPQSATLFDNRLGTAPGMLLDKNGVFYIFMPGVPYEMKAIMEDHVLPWLASHDRKDSIQHRTILTAGLPESTLAEEIKDIESNLPSYIKLAYLPSLKQVRLRLSGKHSDQKLLSEGIKSIEASIVERLGDSVFGFDQDTQVAKIGHICRKNKLMIATAESCTGGHIAHSIVSEAGSSDFFSGAVVAYSNDIKQNILNVDPSIIQAHGAVSKPCVEAMITGVLSLTGADVGVAISGIAGPGGGTPQKPVGTIWIAVGDHEEVTSFLLKGGKDRLKNIEYSSAQALNAIRKFLIKKYKQ